MRTAPASRAEPAPTPDDEAPLIDLGGMLRESPPWLLSAIVHMLAMIIFGIMFVQAQQHSKLVLDAGYSEDFGDPIAEDLQLATDTFEVEEYSPMAEDMPLVEDPLATPDVAEIAPNAAMPVGTVTPTTIGLALTGREPGMKEALLKSSGGTGKTENAVAPRPAVARQPATTEWLVEPDRSLCGRLAHRKRRSGDGDGAARVSRRRVHARRAIR